MLNSPLYVDPFNLLVLTLMHYYLDDTSKTDTYPTNACATVGKIGDEQIFYLMTRGFNEEDALTLIVNGFMEPFTKELPMEYAVELNRLIKLEMDGSVG